MSTLTAPVSPSRHLCDVAFRSGPPEPLAFGEQPPGPTEVWTLDDVLAALARGAGVIETRSGLRLCHAHLRPGLAEALSVYTSEVRAWLDLDLTSKPVAPALRGWPPQARLYVAWLDAVLLPSRLDLQIRPGERVANRDAFRASIEGRLWAGPSSPVAGPLLLDLAILFERYAPQCTQTRAPARTAALAA